MADGHHAGGIFPKSAGLKRRIDFPAVTDAALFQQCAVAEVKDDRLIVRLGLPGLDHDRLQDPPAPAHDRGFLKIHLRWSRQHDAGRLVRLHHHDLALRRGRLGADIKFGPRHQKTAAVELPIPLQGDRIVKVVAPRRIRRRLLLFRSSFDSGAGGRGRLRRGQHRRGCGQHEPENNAFHLSFLLEKPRGRRSVYCCRRSSSR